jgi:hypothetical protein
MSFPIGTSIITGCPTGISFPDQKSLQNMDWGFSPGGLTRKNKTLFFPKNRNSRIRFQTG